MKTDRLSCVSLNNILHKVRTLYPDAFLQYTYLDRKHKHTHTTMFENDLIAKDIKQYVYVLMTLTKDNFYEPYYVGDTSSLLYNRYGSEIKFDGKEGVKKFNTGFRNRVRPIDTSMIIIVPCVDDDMVADCRVGVSELIDAKLI